MNQEEGDVPYLYDCRLVDDLKIKAAPPVDHAGWIFTKDYFIKRPGVYIQQQIQWKSLEAYSYFRSGHA